MMSIVIYNGNLFKPQTFPHHDIREGCKEKKIKSLVFYDKKSDKGSKSVRMRHENSGASKVVENWLPTRVSDTSDAQLSDYV